MGWEAISCFVTGKHNALRIRGNVVLCFWRIDSRPFERLHETEIRTLEYLRTCFCVIVCVFWGMGSHAGRADEASRLNGGLSQSERREIVACLFFLFGRNFFLFVHDFLVSHYFCCPPFFARQSKARRQTHASSLYMGVGGWGGGGSGDGQAGGIHGDFLLFFRAESIMCPKIHGPCFSGETRAGGREGRGRGEGGASHGAGWNWCQHTFSIDSGRGGRGEGWGETRHAMFEKCLPIGTPPVKAIKNTSCTYLSIG